MDHRREGVVGSQLSGTERRRAAGYAVETHRSGELVLIFLSSIGAFVKRSRNRKQEKGLEALRKYKSG